MANPHKGEVQVEIGSQRYTLSFSAGALAELETTLGMGIDEINTILQDPKRMRMTHWRTMFWHGLTDHHEDVDEGKAKALFKKLSLADVMTVVGRAWGLAFQGLAEIAAKMNGGESAANPPQPGAAESGPTGPASSMPGASSAEQKPNSGA